MFSKELEVYECEHWSCDDPAANDSPVCVSHESQFEKGSLDDCPSCDQLKETEFALCGDCEAASSFGALLEHNSSEYWNQEIG